MIVGIDPSYSGTGICITNDTATEIYHKEKFDSGCNVYDDRGYSQGCSAIVDRIYTIIEDTHNRFAEEPIHIICEYPGFSSRSGAWLAILHGYLDFLFKSIALHIEDIVWIPPTLCDSFSGNKEHRKSYLTSFCVEQGWVPKKVNHDISTALIFCHAYLAIKDHSYLNLWYRYDKEGVLIECSKEFVTNKAKKGSKRSKTNHRRLEAVD